MTRGTKTDDGEWSFRSQAGELCVVANIVHIDYQRAVEETMYTMIHALPTGQKLKVKRLKVRLVVQGQHMSKDKGDFTNAFAPVPHLSGVRCCMSIATAMKLLKASFKPSRRRVERLSTFPHLLDMSRRETWYIRS